jgi:S-adenosylmethionine synthetase
LSDDKIAEIVEKEFDLRPYAIIKNLGLRAPLYAQTAAYGHFGKHNLPWEQLSRVADLQKYLK